MKNWEVIIVHRLLTHHHAGVSFSPMVIEVLAVFCPFVHNVLFFGEAISVFVLDGCDPALSLLGKVVYVYYILVHNTKFFPT